VLSYVNIETGKNEQLLIRNDLMVNTLYNTNICKSPNFTGKRLRNV